MTNVHNKGLNQIVKRLQDSSLDYIIKKNLEYGPKYQTTGELDVIAVHGKYTLIFEYKSNGKKKHKVHAREQLLRVKNHLHNLGHLKLFYVHGCYNNVESLKYKQVKG